MSRFIVVLGQGRSGSTLINRLLNSVPGVRISGENNRALDHLSEFVKCLSNIKNAGDDSFFALAWARPPGINNLIESMHNTILALYNPGGQFAVFGFKEIRYGKNYDQLTKDVAFIRKLFPNLRIIFNVRDTASCVKSRWWAANQEKSCKILNTMRQNFERYYLENRNYCYWMPYEELRKGSPVLRGMFDFLDIQFEADYERELEIVKR